MSTPYRVVFYIPRANHLKILGPVVAHILEHERHTVEPIVVYPKHSISKEWLQVDPGKIEGVWGDGIRCVGIDDVNGFKRLIHGDKIAAVVSLSSEVAELSRQEVYALVDSSREVGCRWIALPYTFHNAYHIEIDPEYVAHIWDLICVSGQRSVEYIRATLQGLSGAVAAKIEKAVAISGYPELDGLGTLDDPQGIREKYHLPKEQKILFLASAVNLPRTASPLERRLMARFLGTDQVSFRGMLVSALRYPILVPYRRYLESVRRFADRNGLYVVAKNREKHIDPLYLHDYVDQVVGDVSYYPFTTLELLRVSSLYVGFESATAFEAIAAGLHAVTITNMPPGVLKYTPAKRRHKDEFLMNHNGVWNTPGVSTLVRGESLRGLRWVDRFAKANLSDFAVDEEKRSTLLDSHFSFMGCSSRRFSELLMSQLNQ